MDPSQLHATPSVNEEDEWEYFMWRGIHRDALPYTDGFVIPSLGIEDRDYSEAGVSKVEPSKPPSPKAKKEENIYLGPHGAPPSQSKHQELNPSGRKQRFKQKLKEADKRNSGTGRENKLENLRELVGGGGRGSPNVQKGSPRDW